MVKEDIVAGLRNAVEKGEPLEKAVQTFVNAGYDANDVQQAARAVGGVISSSPQPSPPKPPTLQPSKSEPAAPTPQPPKPPTPSSAPTPPQQLPQAKPLPKPAEAEKPKKKISPIIIVLIVVLVLLIGGLVLTILFGEELLRTILG